MNCPIWLPIAAEHLQQLRVGLADLAAEELHYAEDVRADDDGEAEGGVESFLRGRRRAGKVAVMQDVRDERRLAGRPDAARESDAALEGCGAADRVEFAEAHSRLMPDGDAAQAVGVGVYLPEGAVLPPERRADGFQNPRRGFGETAGFGEHAGRGVLGGLAANTQRIDGSGFVTHGLAGTRPDYLIT